MPYLLKILPFSLFITGCFNELEGKLNYPHSRKDNTVTDTYFNVTVADPYRWLEDDNSDETADWVKAQNKVTFNYLNQISQRQKIRNRLEEIWDYEKVSAPFKRGDNYYYYKNAGLQNHSVLCSVSELGGEEKIIIDPNTFSKDGTVALSGAYFNKEGNLLGYAKSKGGSDWKEFYIKDLTSGNDLMDHLKWIKFSGMSWAGDGFYYSRFPEPGEGGELDASNENSAVYYHQLGTDQTKDKLIYADPENPKISNYISTSFDEKYLYLYRTTGTHGTALYFSKTGEESHEFTPVMENFDFDHGVVGNIEDTLYLHTNYNAPNWRLVKFSFNSPSSKNWIDVLPESEHPLNSVSLVNGMLLVKYSVDVSSRLFVYSLNGELEAEVELPTVGTASGFGGRQDDIEVFYNFTSFAYPPTTFRFDVNTFTSTLYKKSKVDIDFSRYETKQIFYSSRDGEKIPMFITHKKGLYYDGTAPTLLYAYGGFNISINPYFSVSRMILLESGGIYASANLRGGGEYGENWHRDGMQLKKQNVFDDFIAAADFLVANNYTSKERLAVKGGSNGGLLVGAVLNQRPDLCAVAFPAVGVMDMLRYTKFTIGWAWAVEYGNPEESKEMFEYIYNYSPLHTIKEEGNYPAVMVTTADHDDRVVPAHSFKYAATLQEKNRNNSKPLLIRIETDAGHGAGKPTSKKIEEAADIWAFFFHNINHHF
ncbi:MAG: prolyl oligopeptidase family serine peptidase [Candidatus Marinimicrobia bacterium]|nr:prolyl oligopeptidase family serine peptidase [Candidatus Neomarinimicrobiota bacterium]